MLWFLLILSLKTVISDQSFSSTFSVIDQCIDVCKLSEFAPLNTKEQIICERGCRFFNIIHFKDELNSNLTKHECYNSCNESYSAIKDLKLCKDGCELMANKRQHDTMILLLTDNDSTNLIVAAAVDSDLEIIESDVFSDPIITNQLDIGFDIDYKIPETHIRTMPIEFNNHANDDVIFIKTTNHAHGDGGDWLDCASKNFGLPRWILLSAILSIVLIALWLSFSIERKDHDELLIGEHLTEPEKNFDLLDNCKDYQYVIESEKV